MKTEVAREVARIFTKLFPNNNAPSKLSPFSFRSKALLAIFEPLDLSAVSLALLAPVRAVSDPEKKAEIISKPMIESDVNQKLDSISIIYSFPEYQSICLKAFKIFFCKRVIFLNTLYYLFDGLVSRSEIMEKVKFINKNKYLAISQMGYDEYYILPGGDSLKTENETLDDELIGAGKAKLKSAFTKMSKGKLSSRQLLNKFVGMVA